MTYAFMSLSHFLAVAEAQATHTPLEAELLRRIEVVHSIVEKEADWAAREKEHDKRVDALEEQLYFCRELLRDIRAACKENTSIKALKKDIEDAFANSGVEL